MSSRLVNARNELGKGFAGYAALLGISEVQKREQAIKEFFDSIPGNIRQFFEDAKESLLGPEEPAIHLVFHQGQDLQECLMVSILTLADATGAAEGQYTSVGTFLPPRFSGDTEVGRGLGKYQFMTYRSDVRDMVRKNATESGMSDADIEKIFAESERAGKVGEKSRKMLDLLGEKGQDELFRRHVINTLTQIKEHIPMQNLSF